MKKLILFLLISGGLSAQVVIPKSTTTFSNILATGNLTVNGTARVTGASTLTGIVTTSSLSSGSSLYLNAASGQDVFLQTNGSNRFRVNLSYGAIGVPYRVGSTTAPSSTLDVTGTMSVSSSATVAGQFNGAAAVFTGNVFASSNLKVGSQSSNNATADIAGTFSVSSTSTLTGAAKQTNTLNYEGNTTWNTNQTNTLTTGNTGTVAVLSDAVFPITFNTENFSPLDANTYYYGNALYANSNTASNGTITIPYNCTLVSWQFNSITTGGAGSAETSTLSINGTTNYTLSTAITFSAASLYNGQSGSGLSQNFAANDVLNIKWVTPTWVTNPTSVRTGLTLWFVRRQ